MRLRSVVELTLAVKVHRVGHKATSLRFAPPGFAEIWSFRGNKLLAIRFPLSNSI